MKNRRCPDSAVRTRLVAFRKIDRVVHDTGCSQVHWEILDAERRHDTAMRFNGPRLILGLLLVPLILAQSVVENRAADMAKTVRVAFARAETGFDPQAVADSTSFAVAGAIFDPLYTYDYFARPLRMVPNMAMDLPVISDDGRTYTIKVTGIYFANDRAFKGKKRELTAYDYVTASSASSRNCSRRQDA